MIVVTQVRIAIALDIVEVRVVGAGHGQHLLFLSLLPVVFAFALQKENDRAGLRIALIAVVAGEHVHVAVNVGRNHIATVIVLFLFNFIRTSF